MRCLCVVLKTTLESYKQTTPKKGNSYRVETKTFTVLPKRFQQSLFFKKSLSGSNFFLKCGTYSFKLPSLALSDLVVQLDVTGHV